MAMISGGWTECSICHDILWPDEEIIATTHFIDDRNDPLSRYSDSGMHRQCYDTWEHRDEFTQRYRSRMGKTYPVPGFLEWPDGEKAPPKTGPFRTARGGRLELRGVAWMRRHVDPRVAQDLAPLVAGHGVLTVGCGDRRPMHRGTYVLEVHSVLASHLGLPAEAFLEEFAATVTIAPIGMLKALVDTGSRGLALTRLPAPPEQIAPVPGTTYFELVRDPDSAPLWDGLTSSATLALYMNREFPKALDIVRPGSPLPLGLSYYLPRSYIRSLVRMAMQERRQGMHVALHRPYWAWTRKHGARIIVSVQAEQMSVQLRQEMAARLTIAPVEQIVGLITSASPGIPYTPLATVPSAIAFDERAAYFELDRAGDLFAALSRSPALAIHVGAEVPKLRLELLAVREASDAGIGDA